MANTSLTADIIAKEALAILDNELGWMGRLHRAHESEYSETVNGYKKGATISIRRPADFTIREGVTMTTADVVEGKTTLTIDQQVGVDFEFDSQELTLEMNDLSERVIRPAMTNLVNHVAKDCLDQLYKGTYNWVGGVGGTIDSFADFFEGVERLNELAAPMDNRVAVLSPNDHAGMVSNLTGLYIEKDARSAYRKGELGNVGGVDVYMSQVAPTHSRGTATNSTPLVDGTQSTTYAAAKDTWTMTLTTDGWASSTTLKAGDVFTIDSVYMVNPKTKAATSILQNFVVTADVTADETTTVDTNLVISPPIITSGPHQTVDAVAANNATITLIGTASTNYRQNLVFHKNAFTLAVVPMEMPSGAFNGSRQSAKGLSVRVIPVYDGTNDISKWRLDVLYGRKMIDPRIAVRLTAA